MDLPPPPATDPEPNRPSRTSSWTDALASFMRRHHIHAQRGEWYHIHRSHGRGRRPGHGWRLVLLVLGVIFLGWLACQVFLWLVKILQAIIEGVADLLVAGVPVLLLLLILGAVVAVQSRRV